MSTDRIKSVLFYGGLSKDEFESIRGVIWKRNRRTLRITSLLSCLMGAIFLVYALISRSGTWLPYLILLCGSLLIHALNRFVRIKGGVFYSMCLCYGQMFLTCFYAGVLSTRMSNYAIPATSIVVFIALLPLSIDDILARMLVSVIAESSIYLLISRLFKSPEAFSLDMMNVITFCIIGLVFYGVTVARNIREIHQSFRIERIQRNIISSMATVVEERDEDTGGHIVRTEDHVRALIDMMKKDGRWSGLSDQYFENIMLAAPMHDIGKIRIPDAILNKPGKLTPEEYEIIKKHSEYGAEVIAKTMKGVENEDWFSTAYNIARYHHERYDGTGYPDGLKGENIPLEARIMALADVYDALVSKRVYKKAFTKEEARRIIEEGSGAQFDPDLVPLFLKCVDE